MDPPANQAKVYRALLHQYSITYRRMQTGWDTQSRWIPLLIKRKVYRALLHQDSITYRRMQTYWDTQSSWTPPASQAKVYKALLHQDSITYRKIQIYWDTLRRWTPLVIKPKCSGPYYTRTVIPIEESRHTETSRTGMDPLCYSNLSIESPIIPGHYYL